jgi:hypothetical protein
MKGLIRKVESISMDQLNDEGEKVRGVPFVKFSVYVPLEEAGDAMSYQNQNLFLSLNEPTGDADMVISKELKERLQGVFKAGFDLLEGV